MGIFQSFWFGEGIPLYQRLAMKSFIDHGHSYVLYAYCPLKAPAGVEVRDAARILAEDRVFFYSREPGRGSVSGFSNLFRYRLLLDHGGWWVDADVVCLSDHIAEPEFFLGWQRNARIGTAILRFPVGHEVAHALYAAAAAAGQDIVWGETGPYLLTRIIAERELQHLVAPTARSYPIDGRDALDVLRPSKADEVRSKAATAPLLHLWNEIFRRAGVLPSVAPPPGSYLAELLERHRISSDHPPYAAEALERLSVDFWRSPAVPTNSAGQASP